MKYLFVYLAKAKPGQQLTTEKNETIRMRESERHGIWRKQNGHLAHNHRLNCIHLNISTLISIVWYWYDKAYTWTDLALKGFTWEAVTFYLMFPTFIFPYYLRQVTTYHVTPVRYTVITPAINGNIHRARYEKLIQCWANTAPETGPSSQTVTQH